MISRVRDVSLLSVLESRPFNLVGARYLQIGIGLAVLFRVTTEVRFAGYFYSVDGTATNSASHLFGQPLGYLVDSLFSVPPGPYAFSFFWGLAALGMIVGKYPRLSVAVVLCCLLIERTLTVIQDGGDNLAAILLFYMLFLHPKLTRPDQITKGPRTFLHNVAVLAIYLQVCILYLVSGTAKLSGEMWPNGTGIYYVLHTEAFSPPWIWVQNLFKVPFIVTIASYLTIIYQLGFPFMVLNRLHLAWVVIGIGLHLSIGIAMGLVPFSMIMISAIIFSVRDSEWNAMYRFFSRRGRVKSYLISATSIIQITSELLPDFD